MGEIVLPYSLSSEEDGILQKKGTLKSIYKYGSYR